MPTTELDILEAYQRQFERLVAGARDAPRARRVPQHRAALAWLVEHGFPTRKHEAWRYTNVASWTQRALEPARPPAETLDLAALRPFLLDQSDAVRLVFVNGTYAPHLSQTDDLPAGLTVRSLADAGAALPAALDERLLRLADGRDDGFQALNTAFFEDAALVHVAPGTVLAQPVHILHVAVPSRRDSVAYPRTLVVADRQSEAHVVEQYAGLDARPHLTTAVTELFAGDGARLHHYRVVREGPASDHLGGIHLHQGRDSHVSAHMLVFDGATVRNDIRATLDGEGADCALEGLAVLRGSQHVDNHLRVVHAQPHGASRENFRNILDDESRAVFCGRIVVQPGAQKTDAKQTNKNLLLSGAAQADSKPQLEIYADDVKCTHGSTTGQVDDDAIFYLRSRGIDASAARSLLVYAFAREGLEKIRVASLREPLDRLLLDRLPHGDLLKAIP